MQGRYPQGLQALLLPRDAVFGPSTALQSRTTTLRSREVLPEADKPELSIIPQCHIPASLPPAGGAAARTAPSVSGVVQQLNPTPAAFREETPGGPGPE